MTPKSILIRAILRYCWMGPCHWIATLLSFFIVPFIVPFAKNGYLPGWLDWFQTGDNSLDGDAGWLFEHRPWLDTAYLDLNWFQLYLCRVLWLYRNPVYGFEKSVLAAKLDPDTEFYIDGNPHVGDFASIPPYQEGTYIIVAKAGNRCYFHFGGFFKLDFERSINWLVGWKLGYVPTPITAAVKVQICTTLRSSKMI